MNFRLLIASSDRTGAWFPIPPGKDVLWERVSLITGPLAVTAAGTLLRWRGDGWDLLCSGNISGRVAIGSARDFQIVEIDHQEGDALQVFGPVLRGNVVINGKIQVGFDLQGNALDGSVKLTFGGDDDEPIEEDR